MEEIEITIVNWEKYNPPKERVKYPTWFRMQRDTAISSGLEGLSAEQCWVWVQLLSECSRKNSGTIKIKPRRLAELSQVTEKTVFTTLYLLSKNNTIEPLAANPRQIRGNFAAYIHTDIQTNRQTDTTKTCPSDATVSVAPQVPGNPFLDSLSRLTKERLESLYPGGEEFVKREVEKMRLWLDANPKKSPRSKSGWSRFILGWLERGWDRERKHIPSNTPSPKKGIVCT